MIILQVGMIIFRMLDEVLFFGYRKTEIKNPVFITSNPRSGTTYLHQLFCEDEGRFTYFLLYHTFFPSILFYKFIKVLKKIDSKINWPLRRLFNKVEKVVFNDWEGIHSMGFEKPEEDEGIWTLQMMSPAIGLFCPWFRKMDWIAFPDKLSDKKRKKMMNFYRNTMQRFLYAWGKDKTMLIKNVLSTGRIKMLLETFPDAKIIYPIRSPYSTVPSIISMFTTHWKYLAPEIPENSPEFRTWGEITLDFYLHFTEVTSDIKLERLYAFNYSKLLDHPYELVLQIYKHFGFDASEAFKQNLEYTISRNKKYKSKHRYSLEEYGLSKEYINQRIQPFFDKYPEYKH